MCIASQLGKSLVAADCVAHFRSSLGRRLIWTQSCIPLDVFTYVMARLV
jgi:hypothetical protein